MADNRKRASRGGKQATSGSRPIRRNDRAAAPKAQRDRSQAARPQRDRNREGVQAPKGEFIEGRRAAAEALLREEWLGGEKAGAIVRAAMEKKTSGE